MSTRSAPTLEAALDAELEQIAALDRVIRAAQAEQYRRIESARSLAAAVEGVTGNSSAGAREFATRAFVAELATAMVVHEATASRLVAEADRLTDEFTATLDALARGAICVARVRSVLEVASTLPPESVVDFEAEALEKAHRETASAFRRRIRRLRERIHPEPLDARRARARDDRRICLEPADDGMAWLSLFLEAERGTAIMAHLDALADAQRGVRGPRGGRSSVDDLADRHAVDHGADRAAGRAVGHVHAADRAAGRPVAVADARTRSQLVLDLAADLLLARASEPGASPLGVVTPKIYVTVPVLTLLGHSRQAADLDGYGPIDADTARRLAAHAPSFQRILTHPETGATLSYGRTSYRVPADLAGYLRVRDGGCRFPGCSRRADGCDLDHTTDWATGGATRHDNLAHLCRKHHRLKHETGWRMSHAPDGDIRWTSPAGREYVSTPAHPFRAGEDGHASAGEDDHATAVGVGISVAAAHISGERERGDESLDSDVPPWAAATREGANAAA